MLILYLNSPVWLQITNTNSNWLKQEGAAWWLTCLDSPQFRVQGLPFVSSVPFSLFFLSQFQLLFSPLLSLFLSLVISLPHSPPVYFVPRQTPPHGDKRSASKSRLPPSNLQREVLPASDSYTTPWAALHGTDGANLPIPESMVRVEETGYPDWFWPVAYYPQNWSKVNSSHSTWTLCRGRLTSRTVILLLQKKEEKGKGRVGQAKTCLLQLIFSFKFLRKCQDIAEIIYLNKTKIPYLILNVILQRIK